VSILASTNDSHESDGNEHDAEIAEGHLLRSSPLSPSTSTLDLPASVACKPRPMLRGYLELYFAVKFYPEDITHALIQEVTRHLFFLQVKQDILNKDLFCPPKIATHLVALVLQAKVTPSDDSDGFISMICSSSVIMKIEYWMLNRSIWKMKPGSFRRL
jgi:hypothetical protein